MSCLTQVHTHGLTRYPLAGRDLRLILFRVSRRGETREAVARRVGRRLSSAKVAELSYDRKYV